MDIEGTELAITSDDIFWLKKTPGKTLVIGSGYIGVETAGFLNGFGFETEVLYRSEVMRTFDHDMSKRVVEYMKQKNVKFTKGKPLKFQKL